MVEFSTKPPWWMTDTYDVDSASPLNAATVSVNPGGTTAPGWGLRGPKDPDTGEIGEGFMPRYARGEFNPRVTKWRYEKLGEPFAYIMRSVPILCVDIDGKNAGFENAVQLGRLNVTLAETSKSGNGYHLFYSTGDEWDDVVGYGMFEDFIGIVPGIDIRGAGCVYHYRTQRWNHRQIAPLPARLRELLEEKKARRAQFATTLDELKEMDMDDVLVAQHQLEEELAKPLKAGSRNNALFAIGSKMAAANVPDWQTKVRDRATQVGLPGPEADKLVANIAKYGD